MAFRVRGFRGFREGGCLEWRVEGICVQGFIGLWCLELELFGRFRAWMCCRLTGQAIIAVLGVSVE